MRKFMRLLSGWLVASLIAAGAFLLSSWPWRPHSRLGWAVLFAGALPLTGFAQLFFDEVILHNSVARRLDALGSGPGASAARICYVLLCVFGIAAIAIGGFAMLNKTGWLGAL
jgi:hypothetical protein